MPDKINLSADTASHCPTLSSELNSHDGDLTNKSLLFAPLSNKGPVSLGKKLLKKC